MFKKQKQSSKLLEPRSFNIHKNATIPIIVMLGYLEVDIEVSDTDIETMKSNDYKEVSGNDQDANGMLATIQKKAIFSCKDK